MATITEELKVSAENLVEEVKKMVHEGNVRHIVVQNQEGHVFVEIPVTVGVIGALLLPVWAALAALTAYAAAFTIVITRDESPTPPPVS